MFAWIPIRTHFILIVFVLCASGGVTLAADNKVVVIPLGAEAAPNTVSSYNQITSDVTISGIDPDVVNFAYIGIPSAGMLYASATVSVEQDSGHTVRCALSISNTFDSKFESVWKPPAEAGLVSTLASLNQFKINDAGVQTVNHLCKADGRGTATAIRGNLTLFFMPD